MEGTEQSSKGRTYEEALKCLNSLQSRPEAVQARRQHARHNLTLGAPPEMYQHLEMINVDLDWLSARAIHVAGTKGKGTTCAITESILRHAGFTTGLYTSPHLITVRERIKVNGQPIDEATFTHFFWQVWDKIMQNRDSNSVTPTWFSFLTLLAFKVFFELKVDAPVIEVGIGGRTDATNVLKRPAACGIALLDYDHMEILGDTLSDIAFEKTGIFKPGSVAVTVPQQEDAIRKVIERSRSLETDLFITRPVQEILGQNSASLSSLTADFQRVNASLAISLASIWMSKFAPEKLKATIPKPQNSNPTVPEMFPAVPKTPEIEYGILEYNWPGRAQIEAISERETLFIDGAHTTESIRTCLEWYLKQTLTSSQTRDAAVIFHCNKPRIPRHLLAPIAQAIVDGRFRPSQFLISVPQVRAAHKDDSNKLAEIKYVDTTWQEAIQKEWLELTTQLDPNGRWPEVKIVRSVDDAVEAVTQLSSARKDVAGVDVLVTGSLYLVGAVLEMLEARREAETSSGAV
eukprot:TRINITY_DN15317_c0_g1_i1.p1 TRINITY_DN15317_c0_g1~~TRINITY_DN15317_c0_g1_i1.p1  ORF type:complete len:568 (-),score=87.43 TRINITY_DN15317_c0_g1_i1:53-1606(-)